MTRFLTGILAFCLLLCGCTATRPAPEASMRMPIDARARSDRQLVVTFPDSGIAAMSAAGGSPRAYSAAAGYGGSAHAQWLAARLAGEYELDRVTAWHIRSLQVHCVVFEASTPDRRDRLLERLRVDPRIESAQPMLAFETRGNEPAYDDPLYPLQTAVAAMQVPAAHQWAQGRRVSVAIVDTGVDFSHPDLAGRVAGTWNFVDNDAEQFRADRHGTAVAGILAAVGQNGVGIVGVAPKVDILAMKACWQVEAGLQGRCNTLTLAAAIDLAIGQGVNVINLSLAGPEDSLLGRLVRTAIAQGIVVVGSRGRSLGGTPGFPATVAGVLTVWDADDPAATPAAGSANRHLSAPGQHVLTLVPGGRFDFVSGESYSTAMVSGIVALVLERETLAPPAVIDLLERTAGPLKAADVTVVNACRAVAGLGSSINCQDSLARVQPAAPAQK